jgi:hypothetical protein
MIVLLRDKYHLLLNIYDININEGQKWLGLSQKVLPNKD